MGMLLYGVNWVHTAPGGCGEDKGTRVLCNADEIEYFCEYARKTVRRYNGKPGSMGKVDAWLIWNEPDLQPRFWTGTQAQFFALNKAVAEAIRAQDDTEGTHTVLIGGVFTALVSNEWITGLFEQGGMTENSVDGVAFHPYSPLPLGSMFSFNDFREKVAGYGYADKIWVNEMGYPTYSAKGPIPEGRYGTDQYEGNMPEVATKTFTLIATAGAHGLTWYHLFDSPSRNNSDSEAWFGLVWRKSDSEWVRKGGYWGYAVCANNIPGKTYRELSFPYAVAPDLHNYYFEGTDGKRTLVVWNNNPLVSMNVRITLNGSGHKLWDVETGRSKAISKTSIHTLRPMNKYLRTLAFITWEE